MKTSLQALLLFPVAVVFGACVAALIFLPALSPPALLQWYVYGLLH